MIRYDIYDTIRYDTIRYDTIRYVTLRYDTIRYDTIRYDTMRYDITTNKSIYVYVSILSQSRWPRGLRRRSAAARLLRSWVRIQRGAWLFVCCKCCVVR